LFDLPKETIYNSTFFFDIALPDLVRNLCTNSQRSTLKEILMHLDNAHPTIQRNLMNVSKNLVQIECHIQPIAQIDRLELKYMRQQLLIRMRRTFICKNCLSSDVVSIAFTYFLNSAHSSLKYGIEFLLIETPQNPLQAFKKLVLVSQLNPFEFFFDCRKQVEVTRGQIR
jgi:hypothetical protein